MNERTYFERTTWNIASLNKVWMKIDWLEFVRTKNLAENDHEGDHLTDASKVDYQ